MFKRHVRHFVVFRPHIHTASCVVCTAAHAEQAKPRFNQPAKEHTKLSTLSKDALEEQVSALVSNENSVHHTIEELREWGFKGWLRLQQQYGEQRSGTTALNKNSSEAKRLYEMFVANPQGATRQIVEGASCYLDTFCQRSDGTGLPVPAAASSPEAVLSFPAHFTIPHRVVHNPAKHQVGRNDFMQYIREVGLPSKEREHQGKFQRALLAFQDVLVKGTRLPFFLCCGTALGARREKYFIPHDDDIDVGIFYEATVLHSDSGDAAKWSSRELFSPCCVGKASRCVSKLLASLTLAGQFVVFDICGTVEKGLEVRLIHAATGVRIDVNWYYPPLPDQADAQLVEESGDFLWSATYYEQAGQRRHGMYRYLHKSLVNEKQPLEKLFFCGRNRTDHSLYFLVPKEDYLVECFGDDWRVPKAYSYAEGLEGEFRNIIKE